MKIILINDRLIYDYPINSLVLFTIADILIYLHNLHDYLKLCLKPLHHHSRHNSSLSPPEQVKNTRN